MGLRCQRRGDDDHVGLAEQIVQIGPNGPVGGGLGVGQPRRAREHAHPVRGDQPRDLPGDAAEADQAERAAGEPQADEAEAPLRPAVVVNRPVALDQPVRRREDQRERGGGHRRAQAVGCDRHRDPALGAGVDVDHVQPDPVPRDQRKALDVLEARPRDPHEEVEERVVAVDELRRQLLGLLAESFPRDAQPVERLEPVGQEALACDADPEIRHADNYPESERITGAWTRSPWAGCRSEARNR